MDRRGSTGVEGVHGIIDIYDTYLPSGQFYKTIYINMYGAKTSTAAPDRFVLHSEKKHQTASDAKLTEVINNKPRKTTELFNMLTIVLSVIAIVCIFAALNIQDVKRNQYENVSPTLLYLVLLGFYIVNLILSVLAQKQTIKITHNLFGVVPSVVAIYTLLEGSLFSSTYKHAYTRTYGNSEIVWVFNFIWVFISFIILIISLVSLIQKINSMWRTSIGYREKCYKRVAEMKRYLDQGIITQEEFEQNKKEILKNIKL